MAPWCLLFNYLLNLSLVTGQTKVLTGETFIPSQALAAILGRLLSPRNGSLHPRCPFVWQQAVGLGNVLSPGDVGETAVHAELQGRRTQSMLSPVS